MVDHVWLRAGARIRIFIRTPANVAIRRIALADLATVLQPGSRIGPASGAFAAYPCSRNALPARRGGTHGYDNPFGNRCAHCVALECGTVHHASSVSIYVTDN